MKKALILISSFVLSIIFCLFWWKNWMYEGWIRPPQFLLPFFDVDGELIGDVVLLEMFVVIQLFFLILIFIFGKQIKPAQ